MRNIEVKKPVMIGGHRDIMVDGVKWGGAEKQSRGPHGYYYALRDMSFRSVPEAGSDRQIEVWSDKIASRRSRMAGMREPVAPFESRLIETIRSAIDDGRLRDPEAIKAEAAKCEQKRERDRIAIENQKQRDFRARANEAVMSAINKFNPAWSAHDMLTSDVLVGEIVNAMRWAQSRD